MTNTTNLQMPRIAAAQSQKHTTHNEALDVLDVVCQLAVLDRDLTTAPVSPADGSRYIVGPAATGVWLGKSGKVAAWLDGAWEYFDPKSGWLCWVDDEDKLLLYDGAAWIDFASSAGFLTADNLSTGFVTQIGINTASSTTNRLAVSSGAVLLDTVTDNMRMTINKNAVANDASINFQTAFSSRALVGLLGNNDFTIKSTANGTTFFGSLRTHTALHGRTVLKQGLRRHEINWRPVVGAAIVDTQGLLTVTTGTANIGALTTANLFTQAPRVVYSSANPTGSSSGVNGNALLFWRGNAAGVGGFYLEMRFGLVTTQATARGFAGLHSSATAIGNVNPSTLLNCVGVGWDGSETTLRIMSNDGAGAATRTDLGVNFPVGSAQTLYELILSAEPNGTEIRYRVENLNTGSVAQGTLTTDLPTNTVFMTPHLWYNNNATGAGVDVALISMHGQIASLLGSRGLIDT